VPVSKDDVREVSIPDLRTQGSSVLQQNLTKLQSCSNSLDSGKPVTSSEVKELDRAPAEDTMALQARQLILINVRNIVAVLCKSAPSNLCAQTEYLCDQSFEASYLGMSLGTKDYGSLGEICRSPNSCLL
jgi:hypothetical protein